MVNWLAVRRHFPITDRCTYLDHASCGPMPKPVLCEVLRYYRELEGDADFSWPRWIKRREEVRQKVAKFIHASSDEIAFTASTSQGMNFIAELIAGEGIALANTLEFPATTVPWIHRGTTVQWIEPRGGIVSPAQVASHLKPKIKTILTSYVQYQNGDRQDLEAIGAIKGNRFFVVNATQGFGYLPIHVNRARIDFLATNGYKWMMSGYGSGILYVNRRWLKRFRPSSAGWRSVEHPERFENRSAVLKREASRYELGCPPFPHIFAIGAALDFFREIGFSNIEKRILHLTHVLTEELKRSHVRILSPSEPARRSGIVTFEAANARHVVKRLGAKRIYVSERGGGIRVAPHMYNTESDLLRFVKALKEEMRHS